MTGQQEIPGVAWIAAGMVCWATWGRTVETVSTNTVTYLKPVIVEAERVSAATDRPYTMTTAHTAAWTDVPLEKTPVSAEVVPRQVIDDQGVDRLKDVCRNVSGISQVKTEGRGIQFEEFTVRGFSQRALLDGFNLYTMPSINLAGVEQVEALKGPSSSLYGAIEPGGLINIIPKQPEFQARTELYGEVGSYGMRRSGIDSTGPIDSNTAYRVICDYENSDSYRDYLNKEAFFFAPSLTWVLPDQTRITAWLWYQHLVRPQDNGVVFSYTGHPVGPISRNLGGSEYNSQAIDDIVTGLQLDHPINDDLSLHLRYLYHSFDGQTDAIRWSTVSAANKITPYYDNSSFHNDEHDVLDYAVWRFEAGPTEHRLLFGTEFSYSDYTYDRLTDSTLAPISIYAPVYPNGPCTHLVRGAAEQNTLSQVAAGYVQDQADMLDNRLHLLAGGRADYVDQFYRSWSNGKEYNQYDLGFNGRAGLMYDLTEWMSPYVNVCRSFNPNTAGSNLTYDGQPLDPTTGIQYEGGLKFTMLEKRLQMTAAAYQITKDNVAIADPDHPGFNLNGGTLRSEGFDVDVLGQLTPELQVVGGYGHTDTRVVESTSLPIGASFLNVPENSGSLWLKYTLQDGPLNGLGGGVGFFAAEKSAGDGKNTFFLPGYTRWDTGVWYTRMLHGGYQLKVQVNVLNVFDKTYYESSSSAAQVEPGYPCYVVSRVSLTF